MINRYSTRSAERTTDGLFVMYKDHKAIVDRLESLIDEKENRLQRLMKALEGKSIIKTENLEKTLEENQRLREAIKVALPKLRRHVHGPDSTEDYPLMVLVDLEQALADTPPGGE